MIAVFSVFMGEEEEVEATSTLFGLDLWFWGRSSM